MRTTLQHFILALLIGFTGYIVAQPYAASNLTLLSVTNPETGLNQSGDRYSGCWGWTHPVSGKEFAIACSKSGTYWVDVTNPVTPTVCAFAAGTSSNGTWREVKSYQNYCYVVCDDANSSGFQIFDMSTLPGTITLVSSNTNLFKRGHTCWVDGSKLYVSGVTYSDNTTSSLNVYSLATPSAPVLIRQLDQDYPVINYVHDAFVRSDTVFASCGFQGLYVYKFTASNTFSILGSLTSYPNSGYNHSSALTPNGKYLLFLDEVPAGLPIKVANVTNLSNIQVLSSTANQFIPTTPHNPFMYNNQYCFVSAYRDGTQLWDISNPSAPYLAAYFDTYPQAGGNNNTWSGSDYDGQWGMYPYFASGNIFALDGINGLFMMNTHVFTLPEIDVTANSNSIQDGAVATSTNNNTSFGNHVINTSTTYTYQIKNNASGTLTINSFSVGGTNSTNFSITAMPNTPLTLTANATATFAVQFIPGFVGNHSAKVFIASNDLNEGTYDFSIFGRGLETTGITEQEESTYKLELSPNPSAGLVKFNLDSKIAKANLELVVKDLQGKKILLKHHKDILSISSLTKAVNLQELGNGLYYVELKNGEELISGAKLIIAK